jgi:hypothetical protein
MVWAFLAIQARQSIRPPAFEIRRSRQQPLFDYPCSEGQGKSELDLLRCGLGAVDPPTARSPIRASAGAQFWMLKTEKNSAFRPATPSRRCGSKFEQHMNSMRGAARAGRPAHESSEGQTESQLDLPGRVYGVEDLTFGRVADEGVRHPVVLNVEDIEELRPELEVRSFAHGEVLEE